MIRSLICSCNVWRLGDSPEHLEKTLVSIGLPVMLSANSFCAFFNFRFCRRQAAPCPAAVVVGQTWRQGPVTRGATDRNPSVAPHPSSWRRISGGKRSVFVGARTGGRDRLAAWSLLLRASSSARIAEPPWPVLGVRPAVVNNKTGSAHARLGAKVSCGNAHPRIRSVRPASWAVDGF